MAENFRKIRFGVSKVLAFSLVSSMLVSQQAWGQFPQNFFVPRPIAPTVPQSELGQPLKNQLAAVMREKMSRTPAQRKMSSSLIYASRIEKGQPAVLGISTLEAKLPRDMAGRVHVHLRGTITPALLNTIKGAGGTVTGMYAKTGDLHAWLGLGWLEVLASRSDIRSIKPVRLPKTLKGTYITEGDVTHGSAFVREQFGATGLGRTIGVISDSNDFMEQAQASFDLPDTLTVVQDQRGISGEGTAMMEIIHDLVPDSQLVFGSGILSPQQMADVINEMWLTHGINTLVTDILYEEASVFQKNPVEQAMSDADAAGVDVFAAVPASESLAHVWNGDYSSGGNLAPINFGNETFVWEVNRFENTGNFLNDIGSRAFGDGFARLFWSDPTGGSANDYDMITITAGGAISAASTNFQTGIEDPIEFVGVNAGERIIIVKAASAAPRALQLRFEGGSSHERGAEIASLAPYGTVSGAYMIGSTNALATFPFNFSLGGSSLTANSSTMEGNRYVFLNPDGSTIIPGVEPLFANNSFETYQMRVDAVAAENVFTSVPGFQPFRGTSASASHAAGIAAQLSSLFNFTLTPGDIETAEMRLVDGFSLSRSELRDLLFRTAQDIHTAGNDSQSGAGILKADRAADALINFIRGVQITDVKQTSARIGFFTGLPAFSSVTVVNPADKSEVYTWENGGFDIFNDAIFNGLNPNTTYEYFIESGVASGAVFQRLKGTFKTLPVNEVDVRVSAAVILNRFQSPWRCLVTVLNEGGTPASNVRIETAVLSASSTLTRLPLSIPTIAPGSSQVATLLFGRQRIFPNMKLRVSGSYTTAAGATKRFSNEVDVVIP